MIQSTPVILIPALACTPQMYAEQIPALWQFGPVTIADHRKHETISEIARSILENAPPRFALAGLSMGGYIAFEILRKAPERVTKLALISTTARPDTPEQTKNRTDQIAIAQAGGYSKLIRATMPALLHHANDTGLCNQLFKMAEEVGAETYIRQLRAIMSRQDSRPLLESIRCPTWVISGSNDKQTPPDRLQEIAKGIAGSRYIELSECGHAATLDQPELVTKAMVEWMRNGR
ncbi:MAG: alpha/beta fold hydrolase [Bdellovibrionia bacterium]